MTTRQEAIEYLQDRASEAIAHIDDIDYIVEHKEQIRALMLLQALSGEQDDTTRVSLDGIKDALRHGENALLVQAYACRLEDVLTNPSLYITSLCVYALCELDGVTLPIPEPPYPYLWALSAIIGLHYDPVPYAPFTREQLVTSMEDDQ